MNNTWHQFASRHPGQPFLHETTLYSLSIELIDALKQTLPQFFTPEQEQFERDLARTASFGFFYQCAMGKGESNVEANDERRIHETGQELKKMMHMELNSSGLKDYQVEEYFTAQEDAEKVIEERRRAYTGWLVLNSAYLVDIAQLRHNWESYVATVKRFPTMPRWFVSAPVNQSEYDQHFVNACIELYAKWGLDSLSTWEWPEPMQPNLNIPILEDSPVIAGAGVRVFLPWHLLRGGKFELQQVIRSLALYSSGSHLHEWLYATPSHKNAMGDIRYQTIEYLYRYYILVLRRRYATSCKRKKGQLEEVFSSVLKSGAESIRKLRQEVERSHPV